jgi:hypothetical protein
VDRADCFFIYKSAVRKFKVATELIGLWSLNSINKFPLMTIDGQIVIVPFLVAMLGSVRFYLLMSTDGLDSCVAEVAVGRANRIERWRRALVF